MFANYISDKSLDPEYIKNSVNSKGKKNTKKIEFKNRKNTRTNTPPDRTYVPIST